MDRARLLQNSSREAQILSRHPHPNNIGSIVGEKMDAPFHNEEKRESFPLLLGIVMVPLSILAIIALIMTFICILTN